MRSPLARPGQFWTLSTLPVALVLALVLGGCGTDAEVAPPSVAGSSEDPTVATDSAEPDADAESNDGSGDRVDLGASDALVWGEGDHGLVIVPAHSEAWNWEAQALEFAEDGIPVVVITDWRAELGEPWAKLLTAAVDYLKAERGAQDVALLCLSVRCLSVMDAVTSSPGSYDQFVLVSPAFGDVAALGDAPKLFIYSPDDPAAEFTEPLIEAALGQDNVVLEVAGSAHAEEMFVTSARAEVMEAIVRRLIG